MFKSILLALFLSLGVCAFSASAAPSPDGKCNYDSDCGGNGAKCNSGKCSNSPGGKCNYDSECPGGRCFSGKCEKK